MRVLNYIEVKQNCESIRRMIKEGALFIHPTDTIYGIGCDANNFESVRKIIQLKGRHNKPLSVIAPSKNWIREHCQLDGDAETWLEKLPGPYTLILKLKNPIFLPEEVTKGLGTVGIRIPKHWISEIVNECGYPIITTSANKQGKDFMTSLDTLDPDIKAGMSFAMYEKEKQGRPSKIVNLHEDGEVLER